MSFVHRAVGPACLIWCKEPWPDRSPWFSVLVSETFISHYTMLHRQRVKQLQDEAMKSRSGDLFCSKPFSFKEIFFYYIMYNIEFDKCTCF